MSSQHHPQAHSPAATPLLEMAGISKSYSGVRALINASLAVAAGEAHAVMGENGAGKSTLMKILAGAVAADSGEIRLGGSPIKIQTPQQAIELGISIIYQELNLIPHLSVAENIFLGREPRSFPGWANQRKMRRAAQALMDSLGAGVDARALVGGLPLAKRQMVEIAKATSRDSKVIVMDEPSATLTGPEIEHLFTLIEQLKASGISVVYISHRMEEVFRIADAVTIMRDGATIGAYRIGEISRDEILRRMVGRELSETFPAGKATPGEPVLAVKNLTRGRAVRNVSFDVRAGEIVALAGLVGAGRTEIARCIFGADSLSSGEMTLSGHCYAPRAPGDAIKAGVGFVTEDRKAQGAILSLTVRENISLPTLGKWARAGFVRRSAERQMARQSVERLRVRTPSVEQSVGNLSGGNQQKVILAKWLQMPLKLLILDEPTRGIDVGAKQEIYRIINDLAAQGVAILMISSELPEVLGMADRVLVVRGGSIAGDLSRAEATQESVARLALAG